MSCVADESDMSDLRRNTINLFQRRKLRFLMTALRHGDEANDEQAFNKYQSLNKNDN